jgi:hypothetical protein
MVILNWEFRDNSLQITEVNLSLDLKGAIK